MYLNDTRLTRGSRSTVRNGLPEIANAVPVKPKIASLRPEVVAAIVLGGFMVACGSGIVGRARGAAPEAIAQHMADARGMDASELVDVPPSAAWNATVDVVRETG